MDALGKGRATKPHRGISLGRSEIPKPASPSSQSFIPEGEDISPPPAEPSVNGGVRHLITVGEKNQLFFTPLLSVQSIDVLFSKIVSVL